MADICSKSVVVNNEVDVCCRILIVACIQDVHLEISAPVPHEFFL